MGGATASARLEAPSLLKMAVMWSRTLFALISAAVASTGSGALPWERMTIPQEIGVFIFHREICIMCKVVK